MTQTNWLQLLKTLEIEWNLPLHPAQVAEISVIEAELGIQLPTSYRNYCMVFGPGSMGGSGQFRISVPHQGGREDMCSLAYFNRSCHEQREYEVYAKDRLQYKRGIFFGFDEARSDHFFDPADITDPENNEYAVYTIFDGLTREGFWPIQRSADNFWQFVTECCLGDKHDLFLDGFPVRRVFFPSPLN